MASAERQELRGSILDGRYQLARCIGVGGTGVVFEAKRLSDGYPVVVKTLRPVFAYNADLNRRISREREVAHRVAHPSIVPVLDEGRLPDGSVYLVLERIHGEPLNRLLRRVGILGVRETLTIARRTCDVLHHAHAAGYVHRDVKPEHIILDRDRDGSLRVWLLDFGVCAAATAPEGERERERGRVFGTPSYVSPEQASGNPDVDARADVFGLGIVVFEALCGRVPFSAGNVTQLLRRIIREDAPRVGLLAPQVTRELDTVVGRMLSRLPQRRYPNMRAVSRALAPFIGDQKAVERRLAANIRAGAFPPDAGSTTIEHDAPAEQTKRGGAELLAAAFGL